MIHKDLRDLAIVCAFAANGQTMKMECANILVRGIVANLSNERRRSCHKREMNRWAITNRSRNHFREATKMVNYIE